MKPAAVVKDPAALQPGRWYALGIADEFDEINWANAQLLKYEGDGRWVDEIGREVTRIYDPLIDNYIAPSAADGFVLQS